MPPMTLLKSYLLVALRQLFTHKLYSAINIVGLAVGLACAILMLLFVRYELGFDERFPMPSASTAYPPTSSSAAKPLRTPPRTWRRRRAQLELDFPDEIEQPRGSTRANVCVCAAARIRFYEDGSALGGPELLRDLRARLGRGRSATRARGARHRGAHGERSRKYFGAENPLGQTLLLENQWPLTVTGVIGDLPRDTHLTATAIASMDTAWNVLNWNYDDNWSFTNFHTYVRLKTGARIEPVESRLADFVARHKRPIDRVTSMTATKVTDIHLSGRSGELAPPGSPANVWAFSAVAIAILLIACVNFTNLATARAVQRAREVGVRKSLGAARRQLVGQFLGEAIWYAVIAMLLAAALVELLLPRFNAFAGTALTLDYFGGVRVAAALAAFAAERGSPRGRLPRVVSVGVRARESAEGRRDTRRERRAAACRACRDAVRDLDRSRIVTAVIYGRPIYARNLDLGFETRANVILTGIGRDRWRRRGSLARRAMPLRSRTSRPSVDPPRSIWR